MVEAVQDTVNVDRRAKWQLCPAVAATKAASCFDDGAPLRCEVERVRAALGRL